MTSPPSKHEFDALRVRSQQLLIDFIEAEVLLGMTFAEVAEAQWNLGHFEHFEHAKKDAQKAWESIRAFGTRITSEEKLAAVERDSKKLEHALAKLNQKR